VPGIVVGPWELVGYKTVVSIRVVVLDNFALVLEPQGLELAGHKTVLAMRVAPADNFA